MIGVKDFLDTLTLLFTYPCPILYPTCFKVIESVKVGEVSVKGSVKG